MLTVTAVGNASGAVTTAFKTSYWSFKRRKPFTADLIPCKTGYLFAADLIPCKTGYLFTEDLTLLPELSFYF